MYETGGKPAEFVVSDICDGVVQATEGMNDSLVSRDIMAAMVEIHGQRGRAGRRALVASTVGGEA